MKQSKQWSVSSFISNKKVEIYLALFRRGTYDCIKPFFSYGCFMQPSFSLSVILLILIYSSCRERLVNISVGRSTGAYNALLKIMCLEEIIGDECKMTNVSHVCVTRMNYIVFLERRPS